MLRFVWGLAVATVVFSASAQDTVTTAEPRDTTVVDDYFVVKETRDTVFVVRKREVESFVQELKAQVDSLRFKSIGIGGGPQYGMMALQMTPVLDFLSHDSQLRPYRFDIRESAEAFPVTGGLGYLGVGNGIRIGGGGIGGARSFASAVRGDSIATVKVRVNAGGFLVEKVTVKDRQNYLVGGYIGGGRLKLTAGKYLVGEQSVFEDIPKGETWSTSADFIHLELHGGFTHTLLPWFHLGADLSIPLFISVDGFEYYSNDFLTVNPTARVRFMFGNIG